MEFILRPGVLPDTWVIVSKKGHVISGPVLYKLKHEAIVWAKVFISSWSSSVLIVE